MKKVLSVTFILILLFLGIGEVVANDTTNYTLQFNVINNSENEKVEVYILLPKQYILFMIEESGLNLEYNKAETLKNHNIGINVEKSKILDETYEENAIEYVQIKLEQNEKQQYTFDISNNYTNMDMKYRVVTPAKDYIIHVENFKVENGVCKIQYDYQENSVKQEDKKVITNSTIMLSIILFFIIVIGLISYYKQRR